MTALQYAAKTSQPALIRLLADKTPEFQLLQQSTGANSVLKLLIQPTTPSNEDTNLDLFKLIFNRLESLKNPINSIRSQDLLNTAIENDRPKTVEFILATIATDKTPATFVCHTAARTGSLKILDLLYRHGQVTFSPDPTTGNNIFHVAAQHNSHQFIRQILEITPTRHLLQSSNAEGHTPLFTAIKYKAHECVEILFSAGMILFHYFSVFAIKLHEFKIDFFESTKLF